MTGESPAIRVLDVVKRFGGPPAVDGVTLEVPRNSVFGLVGPNGAGKTTLFSLIAGFLRPSRGRIEVLGVPLERVSELRGRLSILPQDAQFAPNIPILEQLTFLGRLAGVTAKAAEEEARQALERVGLSDVGRKIARVLSHGMAKRLGIAQAFLGKPEVILLDEPTAGLDPANARAIRELCATLRATATLVISSHNLPEIQEMCSHVAILDRGRLVLSDRVDAVVRKQHKVRMTFTRPLVAEEVALIVGVRGVTAVGADAGGEVAIGLDLDAAGRAQAEVIAEIVQRLAATGVWPKQVSEGDSLESRFLQVTGKS